MDSNPKNVVFLLSYYNLFECCFPVKIHNSKTSWEINWNRSYRWALSLLVSTLLLHEKTLLSNPLKNQNFLSFYHIEHKRQRCLHRIQKHYWYFFVSHIFRFLKCPWMETLHTSQKLWRDLCYVFTNISGTICPILKKSTKIIPMRTKKLLLPPSFPFLGAATWWQNVS